MTTFAVRWFRHNPRAFLILAAIFWWCLYETLLPFSEWLVGALPVARESHLGGALQFLVMPPIG